MAARLWPRPLDWVHQLDESSWAGPERHRRGDELVRELARITERLIGVGPVRAA